MTESLLYKSLKDKKIQCRTCCHYCVLSDGQYGQCGVRRNQNGRLYFLPGDKLIAVNIDPVEKKPLYHFLPGTPTLSLATTGCNFSCLNCQNADISQSIKTTNKVAGESWPADKIIELALEQNIPSISYTYTEPTIFLEYALPVMKLVHEKEIKNIWVSNGYWSPETFKLIKPYLNAVNIDLKFYSDKLYQNICNAHLAPILDNLKSIKKNNIWLEVTTLLIPKKTDKDNQLKKIPEFIVKYLGAETPWHISAFYPTYKFKDLSPTSPELIDMAYDFGQRAGLKYVYVGNLDNDQRSNTNCPKCQTLNIQRHNYLINRYDHNGFCRKCGYNLNIN